MGIILTHWIVQYPIVESQLSKCPWESSCCPTRAGSSPAVLLLALVTVETGGLYMLKIVPREAPTSRRSRRSSPGPATPTPGVLLLLALLIQPYADADRPGRASSAGSSR